MNKLTQSLSSNILFRPPYRFGQLTERKGQGNTGYSRERSNREKPGKSRHAPKRTNQTLYMRRAESKGNRHSVSSIGLLGQIAKKNLRPRGGVRVVSATRPKGAPPGGDRERQPNDSSGGLSPLRGAEGTKSGSKETGGAGGRCFRREQQS